MSVVRKSRAPRADTVPPMPVAGPLYFGPQNTVSVLGWSWRYTRDKARRLDVEILQIGSKPLIRAAELVAAIEREAQRKRPPAEPLQLTEQEDRAAMLRNLGLREKR